MQKSNLRFPILVATTLLVIFSSIAAWKYATFRYDALDLAIFTQTISETASGNFFGLTIHPHRYLGDHLELFLVVLSLLFRLLPHPGTLLFLQAAALSASVIPVYFFSRDILSERSARIVTIAYALYPAIWNTAFFEFHGLAFAPIIVLFTAWLFARRKFLPFFILLLLSFTIREELALVGFSFALIALIERRSLRWSFIPGVLSIAWFFAALQVTTFFSGYPSHKFLIYYAWLGTTLPEIILNAIKNPIAVIFHLFLPSNLFFLLAVLAPVLFLSLVRPKWLLLSAFPFLLAFLNTGGANEVLLFSHHASLLMPGIILSGIEGFNYMQQHPPRILERWMIRDRAPVSILCATVVGYSFVTLTPVIALLPGRETVNLTPDIEHARSAVQTVQPSDRVAASFAFLPSVASRPAVYSLHYVFIGHPQFDFDGTFPVPDVDRVLIDTREILTYPIQFFRDEDAANVRSGSARLQKLVEPLRLTSMDNEILVFSRTGKYVVSDLMQQLPVPSESPATSDPLTITQLSSGTLSAESNSPFTIPVALTMDVRTPTDRFFHPVFEWKNVNGDIIDSIILPMGYGFFPTPSFSAGQRITTQYMIEVPASASVLHVRLAEITGKMGISDLRSRTLLDAKLLFLESQGSIDVSELTTGDLEN